MKKIITLLLSFTMLLSLVACGGETNKDDTTNKSNTANESNAVSSADKTVSSHEETTKEENTFTEIVAVDNEECTIKITGIEDDSIWGYTLKVMLENKSAEKTYMFAVQSASVNGVQCDPFFASDVAAGKKANEEIIFSDDVLEENGLTDYTDIEITFIVYDSDNWADDYVAEETIHVYPSGEENAVKFVRAAQPSDNVIIDNENVTVIVTGYKQDEFLGYIVNLFLVNKTDMNLRFSTDNASVNGFMEDPYYSTTLSVGKCAFSSILWPNSSLEDNNITDVETIEFNLRISDDDDWTKDDISNELIKLNP